MLELIFLFNGGSPVYGERLKAAFEGCALSFSRDGEAIHITFDSGQQNWGNIWRAVWSLTEQEWFVGAVKGWELAVFEGEQSFREDLLSYCRKNKKGGFAKPPFSGST